MLSRNQGIDFAGSARHIHRRARARTAGSEARGPGLARDRGFSLPRHQLTCGGVAPCGSVASSAAGSRANPGSSSRPRPARPPVFTDDAVGPMQKRIREKLEPPSPFFLTMRLVVWSSHLERSGIAVASPGATLSSCARCRTCPRTTLVSHAERSPEIRLPPRSAVRTGQRRRWVRSKTATATSVEGSQTSRPTVRRSASSSVQRGHVPAQIAAAARRAAPASEPRARAAAATPSGSSRMRAAMRSVSDASGTRRSRVPVARSPSNPSAPGRRRRKPRGSTTVSGANCLAEASVPPR
jgi:hypothetical protein